MPSPPDERRVLEKLTDSGRTQPLVRAMILTSSRARPDADADALSDYDVVLAVADHPRFEKDDGWISAYGRPLVRWSDRGTLLGVTTLFHGVLYEDYVKVDYSVWPDLLLERISAEPHLPDCLDVGYRVLLDTDNRCSLWPRPSYLAHIPARPAESEYRALVEEFWWEATYVARSLRRDDMVFAKFSLDCQIRFELLRRMLEWRMELDHNWRIRPGVHGRNLRRLLPPDLWEQFSRTHAGAEVEENWAALFRTAELFRRVAGEVGATLGYTYPQQLDEEVMAYVNAVRRMPHVSAL